MNDFSRTLIFFGFALIGAGLIAAFIGKIPGIGKLPGDIYLKKGNLTFYFPLMTCVLLSGILTVLGFLFKK